MDDSKELTDRSKGPPVGLWALGCFSAVLMLLFLVAISLPVSSTKQDRRKDSRVTATAHTLQTMVETYSVDHDQYPASLEELHREATGKYEYWKDYGNPYTDKFGIGETYSNEGPGVGPGTASYQALRDKKNRFSSYVIYAYNRHGKRIQNKGKDFRLEPDVVTTKK